MTKINYLYISLLFFIFSYVSADELISPTCEPLQTSEVVKDNTVLHGDGLLWCVRQNGKDIAYLYGTIHVSDPVITLLPEVVSLSLASSKHFAMEAVPDAGAMLDFSKMMFFSGEERLSDFVDETIMERTRNILSQYMLSGDSIDMMKPWSAFLTMNYPPDSGLPLDLVLLSVATEQGSQLYGLETLQEQGEIFDKLPLEQQARLLIDSVCHYNVIEKDFGVMKALYLERNLSGLYNHVYSYSTMGKPLYKKLMNRLIFQRNEKMVQRMKPLLEKIDAFIAVGAMHLPGEKGVLALLEKQGYEVTAIY